MDREAQPIEERRRRSTRRRGVAALVGVVAAASVLPAADETFYESLDVNVVNVEVYVTDGDGVPVTGLTEKDFALFEDGEPMELTNFYAVDLVHGGHEEGEALPVETAPLADEAPDDRLHLVLFIDHTNIAPPNRKRVVNDLVDFVRSNVAPNDRIMVVSYDGSIRVHQGFRSGSDALVAAILELGEQAPTGVWSGLSRQQILWQMSKTDTGGGGGGFALSSTEEEARAIYSTIRGYAEGRLGEVRRLGLTLKEFVDALAGVRGRKALLYVADGLEMRAGESLFLAWDTKFAGRVSSISNVSSDIMRYDAGDVYQNMIDHANANRVTFYTVGTTAPAGAAGVSAEDSGAGLFDFGAQGGAGVTGGALAALDENAGHAGLDMLAEATGGVSFTGVTSLNAMLGALKQDFSSFYSLGYRPRHKREGGNHDIEVRVLRESENGRLRVRHRRGYRDQTSSELMTDKTISALLLHVAENPLDVAVEFGEEGPGEKKGTFLLPVMVKIPMSKLVLLPQGQFHEGRVTIYVGARDDRGRTSPIQEIAVPIRIPNASLLTALSQSGGYKVSLLLREGAHDVAVGVRDELGYVDATVSVHHDVGAAEATEG